MRPKKQLAFMGHLIYEIPMNLSNKAIITFVCASCFAYSQTLHAGRIHDRETRQQERIQDGVTTGQLNAAEAGRIESAESKLKEKIAQDKADGKLTKKEKEHIDRRQNNLSQRIWRQKHDAQSSGAKTRMMNDQRRKLMSPSKGGFKKAPASRTKKP